MGTLGGGRGLRLACAPLHHDLRMGGTVSTMSKRGQKSIYLVDDGKQIRLAQRLGQIFIWRGMASVGEERMEVELRLAHAGIDTFLSVSQHGVSGQGDNGETIEPMLVLVLSYDRRRLHSCNQVVVSPNSNMTVGHHV